jgi:hypothetical protein
MSKIDYTLWPNTDGNLGNIKVQVPDGNTINWPSGDALVGNFVYSEGELVAFIDTKALIANNSKTTTFPYDYVNIQLDKSLEGVMTFNGVAKPEYLIITYTESGNSGDTVMFKYKGCKTYEDIIAVDPNWTTNDIVNGVWSESLADLEDGTRGINTGGSHLTRVGIFEGNKNLVVFDADLSSVTSVGYMFEGCPNLTIFNSNMKSVKGIPWTFNDCTSLTTFSADLSSLQQAANGFDGCKSLTSFTAKLDSLQAGTFMFAGCTSLTDFDANLPSLTGGMGMFYGCKLNTASLKKIAETINTVSSGPLTIGIANSEPSPEEHEYLTQIYNKGWSIFVNQPSSTPPGTPYVPVTATLDETGETTDTPKPFWAKPVPATEETAKYIDENGNFYNILGGQFIYVSDPDTYGMFTCEEDAAAQMRLTKIEK